MGHGKLLKSKSVDSASVSQKKKNIHLKTAEFQALTRTVCKSNFRVYSAFKISYFFVVVLEPFYLQTLRG